MKVYCERPFERLKISNTGAAGACCYMPPGTIGDIFKDSYEEIWDSKSMNEIRTSVINREFNSKCSGNCCPYENAYDKDNAQKFECEVDNPIIKVLELDLHPSLCNIGGFSPTPDNPACIMCPRDIDNQKGEEFSGIHEADNVEEICQKIKPYLNSIEQLHIQGLAEPFWKDKIYEVFGWLGFDDIVPINISTYTNGIPLNEKKILKYLKRVPKSITVFSVDASTPQTYRAIRRVDCYEQVIENLKLFDKLRNRETQKLAVNCNINLFNINEIEGMIDMVATTSIDELILGPTDPISKQHELFCVNQSNTQLFKEAHLNAVKKAEDLGIHLKSALNFHKPLYRDYS